MKVWKNRWFPVLNYHSTYYLLIANGKRYIHNGHYFTQITPIKGEISITCLLVGSIEKDTSMKHSYKKLFNLNLNVRNTDKSKLSKTTSPKSTEKLGLHDNYMEWVSLIRSWFHFKMAYQKEVIENIIEMTIEILTQYCIFIR